MGAVRQGSWGIGFLLSSALYGLFYDVIGWRGLLMIGILPALLIIYIRLFVKEPAIWVENRRQQTQQGREVRAPLFLSQAYWETRGRLCATNALTKGGAMLCRR